MTWKLRAWTSFIEVVKNFLGNRRAENFKEFVEMLLKSLQDIATNVSINVHFLHSYPGDFTDNCSDMSEENNSIRISKQWKSTTRDGGTNE